MSLTLCHFSALPDGGARGFDPQGSGRDMLFIVRRGEALHAWRNACPHIDGASMAWRKDGYLSGTGQAIVCHAHGARFDIASGLCVLGPCIGQSLTPVAVTVTLDGEVSLPRTALQEFQETHP